jgi:hypothetical protein
MENVEKTDSRNTKQLTLLLIIGCVAVGLVAAFGSGSKGGSALPEGDAKMATEGAALPTQEDDVLGGRVREVIQVSAYTYLRLEKGEQEIWAAVAKTDVSEGSEVRLASAQLMKNFHSKELDRTFDQIYFGALAGTADNSQDSRLPSNHPPTSGLGLLDRDLAQGEPASRGAAAAQAEDVKILESAKASGDSGYRVAELFAQRKQLRDKKILVRGTVVRVTERVMGTNFVHLRDGTGSSADETHDLVLKVADSPPQVGEEVLLAGRVLTDVDLGAGYTYDLLIEDAAVVTE